MKRVIPAVFAALLMTSSAWAQRGPAVVSPDVHPDGTVTFNVRAPNATTVTVAGDWNPNETTPLANNGQGIWSVTIGPLKPTISIYNVTIDGVQVPDPANPRTKLRQNGPVGSLVYVPGTTPELWEAQDVPHGNVEVNWAKSTVTGETLAYNVYTPPGFVANGTEQYPILYLLHGANGTKDDWADVGKANFILDNLIAQGKAVPMILVMPNGYATSPGTRGGGGANNFERYLLEDVMPTVEKKYHVAPGRENRAIVGYSMGGGQTMNIALAHLDLFASIGEFSGDFNPRTLQGTFADLLNDPAGTNAKIKVYWFGCGKQDNMPNRFAINQQKSDILDQHGIKHTFYTMDGYHVFDVWRPFLAQFAPLLFRPDAPAAAKVDAPAPPKAAP